MAAVPDSDQRVPGRRALIDRVRPADQMLATPQPLLRILLSWPARIPGAFDHNTQLASKLETLLNLSGPNALSVLKTDASGFKNFGQFVAAVHVSHNLGIPFSDLQAKMTGPNAVSLGKAIHQLKPQANAKDETTKATKQADEDVKDTTPE